MANISTLGQQIDNNSRLRTIQLQLNELQIQLASGKKTNLFEGLGAESISSQRTRADLSHIEIYQTNIIQGTARSKQMSQGVSEFIEQTRNVLDSMVAQLQKGDIEIATIKQFASDGLKYLRELVNTKDGDRYLFSGSDAFTAPIDDTGAHGTYMQDLFEKWKDGTITTDQLLSSYKSTPETTIGYSPALSSGQARNVYVRADVNTDVDFTVFANSSGFKDILNSLALVDKIDVDKISLEPGDNPLSTETAPGTTPAEQRENFFKMYEDVIKTMRGGIKKLELENQKLQKVEVTLKNISDNHTEDKSTLQTALGRVEDVDITEVAVKINSLQIQLTAAYQVTATLGTLSLTRFI
jgi:flagellar hook-associated protein 3 FlgL